MREKDGDRGIYVLVVSVCECARHVKCERGGTDREIGERGERERGERERREREERERRDRERGEREGVGNNEKSSHPL